MESQVEIIEAQAGKHLNLSGDFNLILSIGRRDISNHVVVSISGVLTKVHRRGYSRICEGNGDGRGDVVEKTSVPKVIRHLVTEFGAREERVADGTGLHD